MYIYICIITSICIYARTSWVCIRVCIYVYISARAKVLTSIKYTITLYMYINMRNRGLFSGLWRRSGVLCVEGRERGLEKLGIVSWI